MIDPTAQPEATFEHLLAGAADGTLDDAGQLALNKMLLDDPAKRRLYVDACMQQRLLHRALSIEERDMPPATFTLRSPAVALAAAAVIAVAGAIVALVVMPDRSQRPAGTLVAAGPSFATLAHAADVAWAADSQRPGAEDHRLGGGVVALDAGVVRIAFDSGASVALQGPARFEIVNADRARLHRGRLTAHAPDLADGFSIDTPTMNVIDRGTAFGVSVSDAGDTDVAVFDGEVDVEMTNRGADRKRVRLKAGAAVRALADRLEMDPVTFDGEPFNTIWPLHLGVLRTTGVVRFVDPGTPIRPHLHEDDDHVVVFPERERVTLGEELAVNILSPGIYYAPFDGRHTIAAGTRVRSYLLQFNPVGRAENARLNLIGAVTFDRPILALIVTDDALHASDAELGAEASRYSRGGRGLEGRDAVAVGDDRHTLLLDWSAALAADQVRVIVDASGPAEVTR